MNFKSLKLGSHISLLIKIGTITDNTFLPIINKFAYTCSVKIPSLGFDEFLESIFFSYWFVEAFSLQKVVEMLKKVVVSW